MKNNPFRHNDKRLLQDHPPAWDEFIGKLYGNLTPLGFTGIKNKFDQKLITCQCACGWKIDIKPANLKNKNTQSCGCLFTKKVTDRNINSSSHGDSRGGKVSPEYACWQAMKNRCLDATNQAYKWYGARGISICSQWIESYEQFLLDVGRRPSRFHSLDRIDNNGNYEPGNVRWATAKEQARNQRNNELFFINNDGKTINEWAELYAINHSAVRQRIKKFGWTIEEALTKPLGGGGKSRNIVIKPEKKRLHAVWYAMIARCYDPKNNRYKDYGGRGITVCDRWKNSFEDFFSDVGERPSIRHTMDRINGDKEYCLNNFRWALPSEQNRHRRNSKLYELEGECKTLGEWAELAKQDYSSIRKRVSVYNWPLDEALGTPTGATGRYAKKDRKKWQYKK